MGRNKYRVSCTTIYEDIDLTKSYPCDQLLKLSHENQPTLKQVDYKQDLLDSLP